MTKKLIIKRITIVLLVLLVMLFILTNLATKRKAELPTNSFDSKLNETFITEYKLLDSIIYIKSDTFKINEVWSAFGIASYRNMFMRTGVKLFPPKFYIRIENGFVFSFKYRGYKFLFPDFKYNFSNVIKPEAGDSFIFEYNLEENQTERLKARDTINLHLLNPQDSLINTLTLIKM